MSVKLCLMFFKWSFIPSSTPRERHTSPRTRELKKSFPESWQSHRGCCCSGNMGPEVWGHTHVAERDRLWWWERSAERIEDGGKWTLLVSSRVVIANENNNVTDFSNQKVSTLWALSLWALTSNLRCKYHSAHLTQVENGSERVDNLR